MIYKPGDLFLNSKTTFSSDVFILAQVEADKWCLVGLNDGNRWNDPVELEQTQEGVEIPDDSKLWGTKYFADWTHLKNKEIRIVDKKKRIKTIKGIPKREHRRIVL
jgi:hypothetical protein